MFSYLGVFVILTVLGILYEKYKVKFVLMKNWKSMILSKNIY